MRFWLDNFAHLVWGLQAFAVKDFPICVVFQLCGVTPSETEGYVGSRGRVRWTSIFGGKQTKLIECLDAPHGGSKRPKLWWLKRLFSFPESTIFSPNKLSTGRRTPNLPSIRDSLPPPLFVPKGSRARLISCQRTGADGSIRAVKFCERGTWCAIFTFWGQRFSLRLG